MTATTAQRRLAALVYMRPVVLPLPRPSAIGEPLTW